MRPAGEPWLRKELLVIWAFVILSLVILADVAHSLRSLQTRISTQTTSADQLKSDVQRVSDGLSHQQQQIGQLRRNYGQLVGLIGQTSAQVDTLARGSVEVTENVRALNRRLTDETAKLSHRVVAVEANQSRPIPPGIARSAAPVPTSNALSMTEPIVSPSAPLAQAQAPGVGHVHQFVTGLPAPQVAEVKQLGHDGVVWLIEQNGQTLVLRPFGTNALGTLVHCSNDDRDYVVTSRGGLMSGSAQ